MVETLRKISVDQVEANLIQAVLYTDVMQRSHFHPITESLHDRVILEREKVNSWPPFIRGLWLDGLTLGIDERLDAGIRIRSPRL